MSRNVLAIGVGVDVVNLLEGRCDGSGMTRAECGCSGGGEEE